MERLLRRLHTGVWKTIASASVFRGGWKLLLFSVAVALAWTKGYFVDFGPLQQRLPVFPEERVTRI